MFRLFLLFTLLLIVSCTAEKTDDVHPLPTPEPNISPMPLEIATDPDLYQAALSADTTMHVGEISQMVVWIGLEMFRPDFGPQDFVQTTDLPIPYGFFYASIRPRVSGQGITLDSDETRCILINPMGSFDRFDLRATSEGTAFVSADINLHQHQSCADAPWPRITERLRIEVKVVKPGFSEVISLRLAQLWGIIWEQFLLFAGGALTIIFGWMLYRLRTRFPQKEKEN